MTVFRFLLAADIHRDSALHGLARYGGIQIDGATRAAFSNLIRFAIDEKVEFVVIAGDPFDGDRKQMGSGLTLGECNGTTRRREHSGLPRRQNARLN